MKPTLFVVAEATPLIDVPASISRAPCPVAVTDAPARTSIVLTRFTEADPWESPSAIAPPPDTVAMTLTSVFTSVQNLIEPPVRVGPDAPLPT